jgi:hypothetical protein
MTASTIAGVEEETLRKASELDSNHTVLTNQRDREDLTVNFLHKKC